VKILDKYILRSFIYTFLTVFVILFLIFILQTVWLFIGELAGKDLDLSLILKFLIFKMPSVVPLVLPLSVVLASIMTFGNFAENYEFAAMKSAGISLWRAMGSLSIFIIILSLASFLFANNVIPFAEYKFVNFRRNIAQVKPAMAIAEGQFSEVGSYNIKVEKKSGESGNQLSGVTIHKKGAPNGGSNVVIKSKTGELVSNEKSNILKLILRDGYYYEDIIPKKYEERKRLPFAKSSFREYVINIDLSKLSNTNLKEEKISNTNTMLTVGELSYTLDSLEQNRVKETLSFADNIYQRSGVAQLNTNVSVSSESTATPSDLLKPLPSLTKSEILKIAHNNVSGTLFSIEGSQFDQKAEIKNINNHWIALYDKFVIAFSCFLMFFIGAPLGAIIRKGGLGLPIVFAVLIFIIFHFANTFGKKLAQEDGITPFFGTWLSTLMLAPLAIVLTHRANNDRQVSVNFDWIIEPVRKIFGVKKARIPAADRIIKLDAIKVDVDDEYRKMEQHGDSVLIGMVYDAPKYGYSDATRIKALKILDSRGITQDDLLRQGKLFNQKYEDLQETIESYQLDSKVTLTLYVVLLILTAIVQNNTKLIWLIIPFFVIAVGFFVAAYKSGRRFAEIRKAINIEGTMPMWALFLSAPLYFIVFLTHRKALKRAIEQSNI
jgi:lipopolysaccharide export system permease protein